ncbi:MAG: acyl-CoA dehydrogenase family protein [Cytophagales bacterium]|nr:acyl-CoA dehydrogenase family protein [Cytophagales bacterium]MDW8385280.1 acyl-CoA dehydrogenase family protein [Flammeovirgaceae bacterium]
MSSTLSKRPIKGGEFLIRSTEAHEIFIKEDFSEEQRMMASACKDFIRTEIEPHIERMERLEEGFSKKLLQKAGELGLLGISIPEEYGGLGMSFNTSMLIADVMGATGSFSTTYGAHTGIGILPIYYYGTEEQKKKYLPKLISGEWAASYCLTEPEAGSDANAGKTKATLTPDGKYYLLNGQKMWITNAGFADLFIVFAKIDQDKNLSAFIVEKSFGGITMNEEEKKMGIKGSSTRQVFFNDCKVPVENMLSTRENGFKIAVNILNVGRIKLGAGVIGANIMVMNYAIQYANQRKQFGKTIGSFGAIKHKLAQMAVCNYAIESAAYRAGQDIEDKIADLEKNGLDPIQAKLKGTEQFAIECAIVKVLGSEMLDYIVDEGVQIYGGMGFSAEAPMERAYRDARIARIYEGTNEINRMLMVDMLIKRAMKGELDLMSPAMAVAQELTSVPTFETLDTSVLFAEEKDLLKRLKKAFLMIGGKAVQSLMMQLAEEQEIIMNLADIMIQIYALESMMLRTEKLVAMRGEHACQAQIGMVKIWADGAVSKIEHAGREAITAFTAGEEQKVMLMGLKRFTKYNPVNTIKIRRQIADMLLEKNEYPF